jgi:hypothetical protein
LDVHLLDADELTTFAGVFRCQGYLGTSQKAVIDFRAKEEEEERKKERINMSQPFRPEDALKLTAPTEGYLCPLSANKYLIEFLSFRIRDMDSNTVLFEVASDPSDTSGPMLEVPAGATEDMVRSVHYEFPAQVLGLGSIGTQLTFRVGPEPVPNFRIIERHYFRSRLLKSFDFSFAFCIPNSTNEWETIYSLPELPAELIQEMCDAPYETASDTFYFVNNELVMHNKAFYAYSQ